MSAFLTYLKLFKCYQIMQSSEIICFQKTMNELNFFFFFEITWEQDNDKFRMKTKALSINKYIKVLFHNLTLP